MLKLSFLFKKPEKLNNDMQDNVLVELNEDDADKVMAVGNSIQSGKWFLNEDMKYSITKKMF